MQRSLYSLFLIVMLLVACTSPEPAPAPAPAPEPAVFVPDFNADSAYTFVDQQVSFGPRIPETTKHAQCAEWIRTTLEQFEGWQVSFQEAEIMGFDQKPMMIKNIIATYNPEHDERVLLCAHWDTRREADQDTIRKEEPILGADDGGSGVGVLMELARVISQHPVDAGIELVFFDAEDQGENNSPRPADQTWCLGAQYWSRNPHPMVVMPRFGILLDMVGTKGAQFPKEGVSMQRAGNIVNLVWQQALALRYDNIFVDDRDDELIDDHLFVNDIAGIPTIDIINRQPMYTPQGQIIMNQRENRPERRFGPRWHTHQDNMTGIDRYTLKAVGEVLLHVLYKEVAS